MKTRLRIWSRRLFTLVAAIGVTTAAAQDSLNVTKVGQFYDYMDWAINVAVAGNYA
jgi:hypothetical protein